MHRLGALGSLRAARDELALVRRAVALLDAPGCPAWLFGGWAEELRGLAAPRPHRDLDLLVPAERLEQIERLLAAGPAAEIDAKRLPHKRAFELDGVMVELVLVERDGDRAFTDVFGLVRLAWPADVFAPNRVAGLRVAGRHALRAYREAHEQLPRYQDLALRPDDRGVLRPQ